MKNKGDKLNIDLPLATLFSLEPWVSSVSYEDDIRLNDGKISSFHRIVLVHTDWSDTWSTLEEYNAVVDKIMAAAPLRNKQFKFKKDVDGDGVDLTYEDGDNRLTIFTHIGRIDNDEKADLLSEISGCKMVRRTEHSDYTHESWSCANKK
jgi:hypothetical protein